MKVQHSIKGLFFCLLIIATPSIQAQIFDFHSCTSNPMQYQKGEKNSWSSYQHICPGTENYPKSIYKAELQHFPVVAQANFEALANAEIKISHQMLGYMEMQLLNAPLFKSKYGKETFQCQYATNWDIEQDSMFAPRPINYFDSLLQHLVYYKANEKKSNELKLGNRFQNINLDDQADLEIYKKSATKLACVISIKGGHNLGHSNFILDGKTNTKEYKEMVMKNIAILKGRTLMPNKEKIPVRVFSIRLASMFENGLCGQARANKLASDKIFGRPKNIHGKMSGLGQDVIEALLDKDKVGPSNRILIDIAGMSLESRNWYYEFLKKENYEGDIIPIIANHVSISGKNWKDKEYLDESEDKNVEEFFVHNSWSMSRQDLGTIFNSGGILSIGLDYNLIKGTRFEIELGKVERGSKAERELVVKALVANLCKIVHTVQEREVWNIMSISSQFDAGVRPLPTCQEAMHLKDLKKDLLAYLKKPSPIFDLYSSKQIENFLYGYTPEEIVDRVMYSNAYNFVKRNLPARFGYKK